MILKVHKLGGLLVHMLPPALLQHGPMRACSVCSVLLARLLQILLSCVLALELISQLPAERKLRHDPKDRDLNQRTEGYVKKQAQQLSCFS